MNTKPSIINILKITSHDLQSKKYIHNFPEYYKLDKVVENNLWHSNQSVFDHIISVFKGLESVLHFEGLSLSHKNTVKKYLSEKIGHKSRHEILIIATLLHDISKADTLVMKPDGTTSCPGHDFISAGMVKYFSNRFGVNKKDEVYTKQIVMYHGFISDILNLIIENGNKNKYINIYKETVGDVAVELVLLMKADLSGSDLKMNDAEGYRKRENILDEMLLKLIPQTS